MMKRFKIIVLCATAVFGSACARNVPEGYARLSLNFGQSRSMGLAMLDRAFEPSMVPIVCPVEFRVVIRTPGQPFPPIVESFTYYFQDYGNDVLGALPGGIPLADVPPPFDFLVPKGQALHIEIFSTFYDPCNDPGSGNSFMVYGSIPSAMGTPDPLIVFEDGLQVPMQLFMAPAFNGDLTPGPILPSMIPPYSGAEFAFTSEAYCGGGGTDDMEKVALLDLRSGAEIVYDSTTQILSGPQTVLFVGPYINWIPHFGMRFMRLIVHCKAGTNFIFYFGQGFPVVAPMVSAPVISLGTGNFTAIPGFPNWPIPPL